MARELADDGEAAADDDEVGFDEAGMAGVSGGEGGVGCGADLHPDAGDGDGPGLVEVGEHGEEEDEPHHAGDARHGADAEHGDQRGLFEAWDLQTREDGDREDEEGEVGGDVDDGGCDVDACFVDALAADGDVPVGGDGLAGEDEGEHDAQGVGNDDEHDDVDGDLEPLKGGESTVEEKEGEFGEALGWSV